MKHFGRIEFAVFVLASAGMNFMLSRVDAPKRSGVEAPGRREVEAPGRHEVEQKMTAPPAPPGPPAPPAPPAPFAPPASHQIGTA